MQLPPTRAEWALLQCFPWFVEVESWVQAAANERGPGTAQYQAWEEYVEVRERLDARSLLACYHTFLWQALSHAPFQKQLIASYPFKAWLDDIKKAVEAASPTPTISGAGCAPAAPA